MTDGTTKPVRLNLGSGAAPLDGWENLDCKTNDQIYPLDRPDESADEIRASHVLEHFSHTRVGDVLKDWVRVLKPGGRLRVAVPDFLWVTNQYLQGKEINVQGYVMGGHDDEHDRHGTVFDLEVLRDEMRMSGLTGIYTWESEVNDCAAMPGSLNLGGYKRSPLVPEQIGQKVAGVMSLPRYGPTHHMQCSMITPRLLGIDMVCNWGVFWEAVLTRGIDEVLRHNRFAYLLFLDFDTLYSWQDVLRLYQIMEDQPKIGALCAMQIMRQKDTPLMTIAGADGNSTSRLSCELLERDAMEVLSGHFGLTMMRTEVFEKLEKPWFWGQPGPNHWRDGRIDPDIWFWKEFRKAGFKVCIAPKIVIGHLEEVAVWPDRNLKPYFQRMNDWNLAGIPTEVVRP